MKNRRSTMMIALFGASLVLASGGPVEAGLKSGKVSTSLTNPANVAGPFTNGTSKGTFSFKGTKVSIKAKGTTVADTDGAHCTADDLICVVKIAANVSFGGPTDLVVLLMAEASGGKIEATHNVCKDRDGGIAPESSYFCPEFFGTVGPIAARVADVVCYAAEPTWVAAHAPTIPLALTGHACEGVILPTPTTFPSTVLFSSGSTLIVP